MSPGIPPSLDRQDQRVTMVVGAIILAAMFVASLYVVVGRSLQAHNGAGSAGSADSRMDAYLAEEERASAYAAVRNHMDQLAGQSGIAAVFCRDCSHRWIDDVIEFQGQVDFRMDSGAMESHDYTARLQGSKRDGWEVLSVDLSPAEPAETGPS